MNIFLCICFVSFSSLSLITFQPQNIFAFVLWVGLDEWYERPRRFVIDTSIIPLPVAKLRRQVLQLFGRLLGGQNNFLIQFDEVDVGIFGGQKEEHGRALITDSGSSATPMHKCLGVGGRVKLKDVFHVRNVDASSHNVRANEDPWRKERKNTIRKIQRRTHSYYKIFEKDILPDLTSLSDIARRLNASWFSFRGFRRCPCLWGVFSGPVKNILHMRR